MIRASILAWAILCIPVAQAQRVSIGFVAGGYGNKDFVSYYFPPEPSLPSLPGLPPITPGPNIVISDAGGYIVGPTVEIHLLKGLSVAADALYKPLHYNASATFYPDRSIGYAPATVVTWQFPVLARYRFAPAPASPFIEIGPSFRASGSLGRERPSSAGFTVGAGIEGNWLRTAFAPSIRYTRWAADDVRSFGPTLVRTRPDQIEFMVRFTWGVLGK